MGLETATIAAISAGASVTAGVYGISQNIQARKDQQRTRQEQMAANKAQEMEERRRQIREERVKRARILQASENTGTSGSSGEAGAIGNLSTNLGANLGSNLSAVERGGTISDLSQSVANHQGNAQLAGAVGSLANTGLKLGGSIFASSQPSSTSQDAWESDYPT